ncbi:hypothetical protein KBY66_09435 [Synechococcus sp. Tobar12-5m-g]|uniref:hypothetical protein n=1 Tax=unclassified Synechococcus TaxID=2626047 RepID=UPI0020CEDE2B|nr:MULTISPECIES: hypothetical protein [unclassified Synechococcus]MCP9772848.1 hypothetical protein [Synechococcus sp. Tobar12-5m-g]MCP9873686.1 hypothetical protein [Synechococcus sp. Cruz CV-v-12]
MASPRGITSSRAYWELKTDQVMDRVFAGMVQSLSPGAAPLGPAESSPIDVVVRDEPPCSPQPPRATTPEALPRGDQPLLVTLLALVFLLGIGTTLLLWHQWNQSNQALLQERNLQLLERLRSLGPTGTESGPAVATPAALAGLGATEAAALDPSLPPPPPDEPWVQELGSLGGGGQAGQAPPLRVPLRGPLQRPVPVAPSIGSARPGSLGEPASPGFSSPGPLPELVGVVQAKGRGGSAIFSLDGTSTSTVVGEAIGATGWRLQAAEADSVVIERNGQQQRVSIGGAP